MRRPLWAQDLLHPLVLAAIAVLVLNDHVLKGSGLLPGLVTGKLSDVVGLFFFPILLVALAQGICLALLGRLPRNRGQLAFWASLATALGFSLVNVSTPFNHFLARWWGGFTMDPTDLLTLPVLALSYHFMMSPRRVEQPRKPSASLSWAQFLLAGAAGLASIATPSMDPCRPQQVRNYPVWQIAEAAQTARGCVQLDAWISRSGKEGLGLTLRARNIDEAPCELSASTARVHIGGQAYDGEFGDGPIRLGSGEEHHFYAPVFFPSQDIWNGGEHEGRLELSFAVNAEPKSWSLALQHHFTGPFRAVNHCDEQSIHYILARP
ncbi:MAG: hypothetical protein H0U74_22350 [Bradymonadaceae bacterium]|nr:hypothetical protein [Lujinxingiaceae bacterium]